METSSWDSSTPQIQKIGIWGSGHNKITVMDVVWVANRNNPIDDSSGVLRISEDGNLQVLNARRDVIWSSNVTQALPNTSRNTHLLDSGNLCLLEHDMNMTSATNGTVIWQSFDHPIDSVLPNMTIKAKSSNMKLLLQPWKSPSDPSNNGRFSLGFDSFSHPNLIIWDRGRTYWRSGPWNGNTFLGQLYSSVPNYADSYARQNEQGEFDIVYTGISQLAFSHYVFSYDGTLSELWWDKSKRAWETLYRIPDDPCDFYNKCGNFATCNSVKSPRCQCLRGFRPRSAGEWSKGNWSSGCIRHSPLQCKTKQDGFFAVKRVKGPDNPEWLEGLTPINCETQCLESCSCLAYAYDVGAGCMHWSRVLIDIQQLPSDGLDIYVRLPLSELGNRHKLKAVIAVAVILGSGFIVIILCFYWSCKAKVSGSSNQFDGDQLTGSKHLPEELEGGRSHVHVEDLPLKFEDLVVATDGFHERHKLGKGGFGQVYKGRLKDGEEIAVKRLSATSGQGLEEFQNEVVVISRLQHRNLVRLVGYCAEGDEKMLVYEYMPNKSLDAFLFDPDKQKLLDWGKRFNIIEGIGRGLTYLHRDSRLRIIHRDLKASNILLDNDLNPKISDFGLARIFMHNQDQDETKRVVGTCGYMSPEYAMEGHFSEKSDVYSFGVLVLEIVTGRRSSTFWTHDNSLTLLGYVWKLWNKKNITVMIDPVISDPEFRKDVERCIQVGLLCVQEYAKDRPSAATVVSMLTSEIVKLPSPKQPGFSKHLTGLNTTSSYQQVVS